MISITNIIAVAALLSLSKAEVDPEALSLHGDAARELVPMRLKFNSVDCNKDMTLVEVCFFTDDYPTESEIYIEDGDDEIGFEMGPFKKSKKTYCAEDNFCPGTYWLYVDDSDCDGTSYDYGEVIIRTRKSKLLDKTLTNFGCTYGPRKFVVPDEGGSNNNNNNNNNNIGSGPFQCCSSGKSCCRCCKDKCAKKYKGNLSNIKDCKTNVCRSHYGKKTCKD